VTDIGPLDAGSNWQVIVAKLHDRGNPADGVQLSVLVDGPEDEARRVFSDTVATAADAGYQYVKLRGGGRDVETWPARTGWTS
jgi:hypothetical protein